MRLAAFSGNIYTRSLTFCSGPDNDTVTTYPGPFWIVIWSWLSTTASEMIEVILSVTCTSVLRSKWSTELQPSRLVTQGHHHPPYLQINIPIVP
jgi:hypothetical protein